MLSDHLMFGGHGEVSLGPLDIKVIFKFGSVKREGRNRSFR